MCERNKRYDQSDKNDRQKHYNRSRTGLGGYKHLNERVEETDSTKKPPKER